MWPESLDVEAKSNNKFKKLVANTFLTKSGFDQEHFRSLTLPATVLPTPTANEFLRERSPDTTEADDETLTWLYESFLWGRLGWYVLGDSFQIVEAGNGDEFPSPRMKLEIFLRILQTRREIYLGFPASKDRVLTDPELKELLDQWKKEHWTWMR